MLEKLLNKSYHHNINITDIWHHESEIMWGSHFCDIIYVYSQYVILSNDLGHSRQSSETELLTWHCLL